jgi:hypothetical protein
VEKRGEEGEEKSYLVHQPVKDGAGLVAAGRLDGEVDGEGLLRSQGQAGEQRGLEGHHGGNTERVSVGRVGEEKTSGKGDEEGRGGYIAISS